MIKKLIYQNQFNNFFFNALQKNQLYKMETQNIFDRTDVQKFLIHKIDEIIKLQNIIPLYDEKGSFKNYFLFITKENKQFQSVIEDELNDCLLNLEKLQVKDLYKDWKRTFLFKYTGKVSLGEEDFNFLKKYEFFKIQIIYNNKRGEYYNQIISLQFKDEYESLMAMRYLKNQIKGEIEFFK